MKVAADGPWFRRKPCQTTCYFVCAVGMGQAATLRFERLCREIEACAARSDRAVHQPVCAFITFEEEEGLARCLRVSNTRDPEGLVVKYNRDEQRLAFHVQSRCARPTPPKRLCGLLRLNKPHGLTVPLATRQEFPWRGWLSRRLLMPVAKRLDGQHFLTVMPADEPQVSVDSSSPHKHPRPSHRRQWS
jgi:hypothetical protein